MTTEPSTEYDVIVLGAGAGGLFTAARLAKAGYRTLVVDRLDKVGGRASTDDIDGFSVNVGAIVIEVGGITEQTCEEIGAAFDIREPSPPLLYRIGAKDVDITGGGWGLLLGKLTRQGAKLLSGFAEARTDEGLPNHTMSTADWVRKYTNNENVHGIFRNMCASIFAVSSEELPARVFLTYFTRKSAFKRFGFHPEGTIGLWRSVAKAYQHHGGELWLSTPATSIEISNGVVNGVVVEREGKRLALRSSVVVSNVGPFATVALGGAESFPDDYVKLVTDGNKPCAMITINFASQERLVEAPGMLSFAKTRRLAYIANFTDTCPEMAPPGWNLYTGTAVPEPSIGDFDEDAETALLLEDLRDQIPDFDEKATILSTSVTRGEWPPQRAVAGFDLPHATPIGGLWNVGDAVKQYANGGTTACAETAQLVVNEITDEFPLPLVKVN